MKKITKDMLKIYVPYSNLDWMNYKLVRNQVTFHHIRKRENGGKRTIENGALLMPYAHQYLHLIEFKDIQAYETINRIFKQIVAQQAEATHGQRDMLEYILRDFERYYKGKLREEYLVRGYHL